MNVQKYITTQFSREVFDEMKNAKDFITFILENDWFFDIGYKINVCWVKPHHNLHQRDLDICYCPCSYNLFNEYENANEMLKICQWKKGIAMYFV